MHCTRNRICAEPRLLSRVMKFSRTAHRRDSHSLPLLSPSVSCSILNNGCFSVRFYVKPKVLLTCRKMNHVNYITVMGINVTASCLWRIGKWNVAWPKKREMEKVNEGEKKNWFQWQRQVSKSYAFPRRVTLSSFIYSCRVQPPGWTATPPGRKIKRPQAASLLMIMKRDIKRSHTAEQVIGHSTRNVALQ